MSADEDTPTVVRIHAQQDITVADKDVKIEINGSKPTNGHSASTNGNVSPRWEEPTKNLKQSPFKDEPNPMDSLNWFTSSFMFWMTKLLNLGVSRPLMSTDLWDLSADDKSVGVYEEFKPLWKEEVALAKTQNRKPRLFNAFKRQHKRIWLISGFFFALYSASSLAAPQLMKRLLEWTTKRTLAAMYPGVVQAPPFNDGYGWAVGLFAVTIFGSWTRVVAMHMSFRIIARVRGVLTGILFDKALKVPSAERNDGAVVSLMSTDAQKVQDLAFSMHMLWSGPLITVAGIWLMYIEVGYAALCGIAVMILLLPCSGTFVKRQVINQKLASAETDKRVGLLNEFVQGVRVLKFYAWEVPFFNVVNAVRNRELGFALKATYFRSFTFALMTFLPLACALVIFIVYAADPANKMDAAIVFTTMSLIYVIRLPFTFLPMAISQWAQTMIGLGRIGDFLIAREIVDSREPLDGIGVQIKDADFRWTDDVKKEPTPRLVDVNFDARPGELISVIGKVASGKSTLISSILGEVSKVKGSVRVGGKLAYVPQTAFIVNRSLRENILFGTPFDQARYDAVIKACALEADLAQLPNGDLTEIGERGINISGGQKQRVSLARAAYMRDTADIFLLDDPLSAVDAHVAKTIYEECISKLLKDKCVIFATHTLQFLAGSTKICVLQEATTKGSYTIGDTGTYDQLMNSSQAFRAVIESFNKGKDDVASIRGSMSSSTSMTDIKDAKTGAVSPAPKKAAEEKKKIAGLVETEEREVGTVDWRVYKAYLFQNTGTSFFILGLCSFLIGQVATNGADYWLSWWSDRTGDRSIAGNDSWTVTEYLLVYGGLVFIINIFTSIRAVVMAYFGIFAARNLHQNLLQTMLQKTMGFFDRTPVGRILNRFTKDMYTIDFIMSMNVENTLGTGLAVIGILVVISILSPMSLIIIFLSFVAYIRVTDYYRHSSRELQRLESVSRTPIFVQFSEMLLGVSSIRALKIQDVYSRKNLDAVDNNQKAWFLAACANLWLRLRLELIGGAILLSASLLPIVTEEINWKVSPAQLGFMITYALSVGQFLQWLVMMMTQFETAMNAVERIRHYSLPTDLENWGAKDKAVDDYCLQNKWPTQGKLVLKNFSMRYRQDLDLVLKNINCVIPPHTRVGICGRTGSGKSSFLLALFRMVEAAEGQLLIDDIDISKISLNTLRSRLAIIPQDPILFTGSFKYNLDPFNKYSEDDMWKALDYVQLKPAIERMPDKLNTMVAEGGKNLSLGQRQLLCLARALLRNPDVLCLDEATANVDVQTDEVIQRVIRERFKNATVLVIAHRLNTIIDSDLIMVLENGNLVEFDTPAALKSRDGFFSGLLASTTHVPQSQSVH